MFTGGPPLVKAAIGEDVTKEELGGVEVCAEIAGSAHNVANMLTQGFHSRRTHRAERSGGGVDAFTHVDPEPGVDVPREFVDQAVAKFQFEASARVINTDLQIKGCILEGLCGKPGKIK